MAQIVTITFSPCIDKSATVQELIPEKKLYCSNPTSEPGGGGINVARALHKLGQQATAVFPSGGCQGELLKRLLQREGVSCIPTHCENETRENLIILERLTNKQFRFGMPGAALLENEWQSCLTQAETVADDGFIIVSGSMPEGVPLTVFDRLNDIAAMKRSKLVVDTSGESLKYAASSGAFLIKPNLGELSTLAGVGKIAMNNTAEVARKVLEQYPCEIIVVSLGPDGAMLVTDSECYRATPPEVERKSTVGAGDSMVAGIILYLHLGKSLREALNYGVACGTAATMSAGTGLCRSADVEHLYPLVSTIAVP